jgi:ribosomal protein S18 acetylase RimI-like enzyme
MAMGHLSTTVRPLQPGDLDDLFEIDRRSFPNYAVFERASYDALLTDPAFQCRVAVDQEDRAVGYLLIKKVPKPPLVFSVAVHPRLRSRGLAGALLQQYLDERPGSVRAFVEPGDAKSIAFYERFGFARPEEHAQEGEPKILMLRP